MKVNFGDQLSPFIIEKLSGEDEQDKMKGMVIFTTKFSYYLLVLIVLPILFQTEFILQKSFICFLILSTISIISSILVFGLNYDEKNRLISFVKSKMKNQR